MAISIFILIRQAGLCLPIKEGIAHPSPLRYALCPMLSIINPINYLDWDKLVLSAPGYSFFHSSGWARALHESYGYKPLYFTVIENGKILTLIPSMEISSILTGKRGVSIPFTDYCAPIIPEDISLKDIIKELSDYGKKAGWKYIEIRDNGGIFNDMPSSSFYYGHTLKLSQDEKEVFSKFKNTTQRNIKKAQREDVKVEILTTFESIKEFYRLNCMTRKEHGLPPQPFYFFQKIYEHIISKGHGFVTLAMHSGIVIAGAMYLHFGEKALYKYGASDKRHQHLRANNLVMWEAIKWYCQNGYETLCLGRTEPENSGLRHFKLGWGAEERVIRYFKYNISEERFTNGNKSNNKEFQANIFRKVPIPIAKAIGKMLYRHVG